MFLNELAEPQLLVIYPGRFQPIHKGHHAVFEWLTTKFGRQNVYITTSNKTDNLKSPFTFAEKAYFMQLTGVPADRIVQASQPYQILNVLQSGNIQVLNPDNTVVIFAVSEKDMAEDPRFSFAPKKDGTDSYFQPLKNIKDTVNMNEHGYIMTVPTFDFKVLGQPMRSGTELREMYGAADVKQRRDIIADLFGRYTAEAEQIMQKIVPAAVAEPAALGTKTKLQKVGKPEPVTEGEVIPFPKKEKPRAKPVHCPKCGGEMQGGKMDGQRVKVCVPCLTYIKDNSVDEAATDIKHRTLVNKARMAHPLANSDEEAIALYVLDKEERDVDRLDHEDDDFEGRLSQIESELAELIRAMKERNV
jgi:cytidyltransferase-like protein